VTVTVYSVEGDPTIYKLFVEPDGEGSWRVVAEYEDQCCWFYTMEKPPRRSQVMKGVRLFDIVKRDPPSKNQRSIWTRVLRGELMDGNSYTLLLLQRVDRSWEANLIF
jgi:hypothetical protein